jgi:hypothetical protein
VASASTDAALNEVARIRNDSYVSVDDVALAAG